MLLLLVYVLRLVCFLFSLVTLIVVFLTLHHAVWKIVPYFLFLMETVAEWTD